MNLIPSISQVAQWILYAMIAIGGFLIMGGHKHIEYFRTDYSNSTIVAIIAGLFMLFIALKIAISIVKNMFFRTLELLFLLTIGILYFTGYIGGIPFANNQAIYVNENNPKKILTIQYYKTGVAQKEHYEIQYTAPSWVVMRQTTSLDEEESQPILDKVYDRHFVPDKIGFRDETYRLSWKADDNDWIQRGY
jgi:hypothetical protein